MIATAKIRKTSRHRRPGAMPLPQLGEGESKTRLGLHSNRLTRLPHKLGCQPGNAASSPKTASSVSSAKSCAAKTKRRSNPSSTRSTRLTKPAPVMACELGNDANWWRMFNGGWHTAA